MNQASNTLVVTPENLLTIDGEEDDMAFLFPASSVYHHPKKEYTLGDWIKQRIEEERKPFQPNWDEIVRRVGAREFPTLKALATAYGKQPAWAAKLRDVAVGQRVFSAAEWKACVTGQRMRPIHTVELPAPRPSQRGGTPRLSRAGFERVFQEKQDALTFDLVAQLVRLGCWKTPQAFAEHFRKPERWAQAFRRLLLREQLMTPKEWRACWRSRRRRR